MKSLKKYIAAFVALSIAVSCDDGFEKVNTNPNVPTEVTPNLLLSGVIRNTINDQVNEAWSIGNIVVQHSQDSICK
jgi:hypothetical protein